MPQFLIGGLSLRAQQIPVQHIVNQGGFAGPGHSSYTGENAERKLDIDIFQIVLSGAQDLYRRI